MLKIGKVKVYGIPLALRFMRMPFESFDKSDTKVLPDDSVVIGLNDLVLAKKLISAGPEHRKFLRDIHVHVEVTAPRYFWSEFDTYKFAVQNSSSTMHLITKRHLTIDDFEHDNESEEELDYCEANISYINMLIDLYNSKDNNFSEAAKQELLVRIKRRLPEGYYQMRGLDFDYETAIQIWRQRSNHRLPIWRAFCNMLKTELPFFTDFIEEVK